jgi:hypothetical protein
MMTQGRRSNQAANSLFVTRQQTADTLLRLQWTAQTMLSWLQALGIQQLNNYKAGQMFKQQAQHVTHQHSQIPGQIINQTPVKFWSTHPLLNAVVAR